jgi:hypothetical protein
MEMLRDNAASQKNLFSILCALSMLFTTTVIARESLRASEPRTGVIASLSTDAATDPDGTFEKVWVEYDIRVDGKKGMRIHSSFVVKNSLRAVCTLVAHFYNSQGAELPGADMQGDYSTSDGHVVTYVKFTPRFTSTRYADKTLFIPYKEFKIKAPGSYQLKFILFLERHDQGDRVLAKSDEFNFKYTKTSE